MIATKREWEEFLRSNIWKDLSEDIESRQEELLWRLAKGNDTEVSDDHIRGRISFCGYFLLLPSSIMKELEEEQKTKKIEEDDKEIENG